MSASTTEALARFVIGTKSIPAPVLQATRDAFIDTIGVALAGRDDDAVRIAERVTGRGGGDLMARVWGTRKRIRWTLPTPSTQVTMSLTQSRRQRTILLCALYFAQGAPRGFMTITLISYLTGRGVADSVAGRLSAFEVDEQSARVKPQRSYGGHLPPEPDGTELE